MTNFELLLYICGAAYLTDKLFWLLDRIEGRPR